MKTKSKKIPRKTLKVLCVTDQKELGLLIKRTMNFHGRSIELLNAETGEEGVKIALKTKPNVVLMDQAMHSLSGIDAARQIKTALPSCKIILLTMYLCDGFPTGL